MNPRFCLCKKSEIPVGPDFPAIWECPTCPRFFLICRTMDPLNAGYRQGHIYVISETFSPKDPVVLREDWLK